MKRRKLKTVSTSGSIKVKTPYEIPIGGFTNISTNLKKILIKDIKRGFVSCKIQDQQGNYNWCEAPSTVKDTRQDRQIGFLNPKSKNRSFTWAVKPEQYLTKGLGKLIVGVFETRDYKRNGKFVEHRPHKVLEEIEVLLC